MGSHDLAQVTEILQEDPQFCIQRVKKQLRDCRIKDIIFNYKVVMAGLEEEEETVEEGAVAQSQDSKYNLEALMKVGKSVFLSNRLEFSSAKLRSAKKYFKNYTP